jgi:hypothetical protein
MLTVVYIAQTRKVDVADIAWEEILKWLMIAVAVGPMVFAFGYIAYEGYIRPALIPKSEIEKLADKIAHRKPVDPDEAAYWEEYAAWHRSESFEQGKWRRVRKLLRKRREV